MDATFWRTQSAALTRQYRTLQLLADVARHEGTADLSLRVSTALKAVWSLVEETDRLANREARYAADEPWGEDTIHDACQEQAAMLRDADYDAYTQARAASECETAEEPESADLALERGLHPVQRPTPEPAAWLPSASGAITRLPVATGLDQLFV